MLGGQRREVRAVGRVVPCAGRPQVMQENRELAGHGDDRAFLCVLAAALSEALAISSQPAVRTKWPQDIVSALNQQPSEILVACLADGQLRLMSARIFEFSGFSRSISP